MNNDNTDYVSNESGTLSRLFKLPQHGTTVRTELIAGMTTFLTMVYIVFVNPQILGAAQMDPKVVFVTTCLIAGIGSIAMGIFANLPVTLAPGNGAERLLCLRGRGGDGYLLADRDGRDILGCNWAIFAHAVSYPVLDDLQHSIKFTYWYHQRNWTIYRLNGIKKYWRYCRQ
ncbi:inorganic anion transporter, sulfate permease (SulP) family [Shigella dysenteriae]|uniref:Inorganic anion transporter, sulfate permease (SulP) family n=1 Tax=Shigella dysenteriae TaxID=622 RepID=A0A2X2HGH9_SHIDY|nr:inorganic anion transporter, sulfate permease (SulP) family [Shigella dysenteriae]